MDDNGNGTKGQRGRRRRTALKIRHHVARFVSVQRGPGGLPDCTIDMSVGAAYARYECARAHCGSLPSIRSRGGVLCDVLGGRRLDQLGQEDVLELRRHAEQLPGRGGQPWAPSSVVKVMILLRSVWNAERDGGRLAGKCPVTSRLMPADVPAALDWRAGARFEREEIDAMLTEPQVPALARALVRLACMSWARAGELGALTFADYSDRHRPLPQIGIARAFQVTRGKIGAPKVQRYRIVPVTAPMVEWLTSWRRWGWAEVFGREPTSADFIVPTPDRYGAPRVMRPERARELVHAACDAVGVRRRSSHDIRRTCGTLAEEAGVDVRAIDAVLHAPASLTPSERYRHLSYTRLCAEISKLRWPGMQLDLFGGA